MDSISKKRPSFPPAANTAAYIPTPQPIPEYHRSPIRSTTPKKPQKNLRRTRRFPWKKLFFIIFLIIFAWCGYFAWKIYNVSHHIQISNVQNTADSESSIASTLSQIKSIATSLLTQTNEPLRGESEGRINILLLGRAGEHHSGRDLTDTIMIMSIDTNTHKVALLSLPRDLYVNIPDTTYFTKINAVYQQGLAQDVGVDLIEKTVTNITGLPMHYAFIIDFDGFEKVVNAIGGINVDVVRDFYDPRYPGPNYSYETFEIKKGWQELDGATALKYVRERHNDPEGDFGRAKRQQQVIQAVKNKAFSLKTFVDAFALNNLLTILGDSVKTTIAPEEINGFIALSKKIDTNNISNVVVDAWKPDSLLRVSHIMVGPTRMFILVPRVGNYSEIKDVAANLFDINAIKQRKESIASEDVSISIINLSDNPKLTAKVMRILQDDFDFNRVTINTSHSTEMSQDASFIIDNTDYQKPFSLDELLKKFPMTIDQDNGKILQENDLQSDTPSDFVMILGNDLNKDLDFEEDSIDDFKQSEEDNIAYPKEMIP